jgi:cytochrome c-type biogenesis protein CcmH/NrfF
MFSSVYKLCLSLVVITCSFLIFTRLVIAQEEPDYDRINQIARQMNCPTCVGVNLADCRTQTCEQWREQINDLIQQGYSDQEVLDYFAGQYGTQVLLEPPKSGSTLALWVLPILAVLAGGGWLVYILRRWNRQNTGATVSAGRSTLPEPSGAGDDYLEQVERDLKAS